jgi:hypothetical protein
VAKKNGAEIAGYLPVESVPLQLVTVFKAVDLKEL